MFGNSAVLVDYTPSADVLTIAICLVAVILIRAAYINKSRLFSIFKGMMGLCLLAAVIDLIYFELSKNKTAYPDLLYEVLHMIKHISLIIYLFLYSLYIKKPMWMDRRTNRIYTGISVGLVSFFSFMEICGTIFGFGFRVENGVAVTELDIFGTAYIVMVGFMYFMALRYRERIVKQIIVGLSAVGVVAITMLIVQNMFQNVSYTVPTFVIPVISILYLVHANPFDLETGAVSELAFEDMVEENYVHGHELIIMGLYLHELESTHKIPVEVTTAIRNYYTSYISNAVLFRITNGRLILAFPTAKNPDYENIINRMLLKYEEAHARFNYEYKIVIGKTVDAVSRDRDYVRFIQYLEKGMPQNDVKFYDESDVQKYIDQSFILTQLEDIHKKGDLDDPRVLVYCQPVWNLKTRKYDTAEALMRLKLNRVGMVYPNQFIPLAEEHKYIHSLSKIILHKTCKMIKGLMNMDYEVKRISVNFSVSELKDDNFCSEVNDIINEVGVDFSKVAMEITESTSESEFMIMKSRIMELKDSGIKFYLDDFGTGYSNFERIMELPFDIIKFDRSLVIASDKTKRSEDMVASLARMFVNMHYKVLYEGVENESDEERCIGMHANYLQGYKYSKPIPIEDLTKYFTKSDVIQELSQPEEMFQANVG